MRSLNPPPLHPLAVDKGLNEHVPLGLNAIRLAAVSQSLAQRALAAEAEAELLGIKLAHAFDELRNESTGCVCDML